MPPEPILSNRIVQNFRQSWNCITSQRLQDEPRQQANLTATRQATPPPQLAIYIQLFLAILYYDNTMKISYPKKTT